jgi:hypothetical protein
VDHVQALSIELGVEIMFGNPAGTPFDDKGKIFRPVSHVNAKWADENDIGYLAAETKSNREFVLETLKSLNIEIK